METKQVGWALDASFRLSLLYPDYQTAPYTSGMIVDLTVSAVETVMILTIEERKSTIYYSDRVFPMDWKKFTLVLKEGREVVKIDAAPDNMLYLVLNTGELARVNGKQPDGSEVEPELISIGDKVVEYNVVQVSAAPDGLVWVVGTNPSKGSVVKYMDKSGEWHEIPKLGNAKRVTGSVKGKAYIINSANQIFSYTKKGAKKEIPFEYGASELSIGPEGRLWVTSILPSMSGFGGSKAYWSDDDGAKWEEVKDSSVRYLDAGTVSTDFAFPS